MVPVADGQALCLEQNAGLAIIGDAERAIGAHQRLQQLPLAVGHPRLVPVKRLRAQKNGLGCESKRVALLPVHHGGGMRGHTCQKWLKWVPKR